MDTLEFTAVDPTPTPISPRFTERRSGVQYQVSTGTFTAVTTALYGRLSASMPWVEIASITDEGIGTAEAYPELAVAVTAATASATPATDKVTVVAREAR